MQYVMSWTDVLTFYHDLLFIPIHYTYVPFTSSPQFTSFHLHFTSLHFTSLHSTPLHFTAILDDFPHTFTSLYLSLS
jgi:hypothetical protein